MTKFDNEGQGENQILTIFYLDLNL